MTDEELEAMKRDAKDFIGWCHSEGLDEEQNNAAYKRACNVLTLAAEVERMRAAVSLGAISSGQFTDKDVPYKVATIEAQLADEEEADAQRNANYWEAKLSGELPDGF